MYIPQSTSSYKATVLLSPLHELPTAVENSKSCPHSNSADCPLPIVIYSWLDWTRVWQGPGDEIEANLESRTRERERERENYTLLKMTSVDFSFFPIQGLKWGAGIRLSLWGAERTAPPATFHLQMLRLSTDPSIFLTAWGEGPPISRGVKEQSRGVWGWEGSI